MSCLLSFCFFTHQGHLHLAWNRNGHSQRNFTILICTPQICGDMWKVQYLDEAPKQLNMRIKYASKVRTWNRGRQIKNIVEFQWLLSTNYYSESHHDQMNELKRHKSWSVKNCVIQVLVVAIQLSTKWFLCFWHNAKWWAHQMEITTHLQGNQMLSSFVVSMSVYDCMTLLIHGGRGKLFWAQTQQRTKPFNNFINNLKSFSWIISLFPHKKSE